MGYQERASSVSDSYRSVLPITDVTIGKVAGIDPNKVHLDAKAAQEAGFRDRLAHGVTLLAYAVGNAQQQAYNGAALTHLNARFLNPAYLGDSIESVVSSNDNRNFEATVVNPLDTSKPYSKMSMTFGDRESYFAMPLAAAERMILQAQLGFMAATNTDSLALPNGYIKRFPVQPISGHDIPEELHVGFNELQPLLYVSGVLGNHFPGQGTIYASQEAKFITNPLTKANLHKAHEYAVVNQELNFEQKGPRRKSTIQTTVWDISYFPFNFPYLVMDGKATVVKNIH